MSDNYIVINGKKAELTKEQLKQLGIEVESKRNSPFDRVKEGEMYYYCDSIDNIGFGPETSLTYMSDKRFDALNYFNDENFANQVMLHQQLYRKLLKYAYDNNSEVTTKDWETTCDKHFIYYNHMTNKFDVQSKQFNQPFGGVYFKSSSVTEKAIKDIIKPFVKQHPEFVW